MSICSGDKDILSSQKRRDNINSLYTTLENLTNLSFGDAIRETHRIVMNGWDLRNLQRYSTKDVASKRKLEYAQPGNYRTDYPEQFTDLRWPDHFFLCPSSSHLLPLMKLVSTKYEQFIEQVKSLHDVYLLASWTMSTITLLHPFYEGNGRTSRAILPYTLLRCGFSPQFLENSQKKTDPELDGFVLPEEICEIFNIGNLFAEKTQSGGIASALFETDNTLCPVDFYKYFPLINNAIKARIRTLSLEDLRKCQHHIKGAYILSQTPFERY